MTGTYFWSMKCRKKEDMIARQMSQHAVVKKEFTEGGVFEMGFKG